jgi:hypothetical protein
MLEWSELSTKSIADDSSNKAGVFPWRLEVVGGGDVKYLLAGRGGEEKRRGSGSFPTQRWAGGPAIPLLPCHGGKQSGWS